MKRKTARGRRGSSGNAWVVLLIVLVILLSVVLAGLLYLSSLLGLIHFPGSNGDGISREGLLAYLEEHREILDPDYTGDVVPEQDITLETVDGDILQNENVVNILLIGQDARPGETRARADAIILCAYNKASKELTLISFMRDMYVQIPGYPNHKLNAAFAWGGMALLEETLAVNFGVAVDGSLCVDFAGFEKVIDQIGGVSLWLDADEAQYMGSQQYAEGIHQLSGAAALKYARMRMVGNGDFDRTARQQKVLCAIWEKCRDMGFGERNRLAQSVLPLLSTNMKKGELIEYGTMLLLGSRDLRIKSGLRIPAEEAYQNAWVSDMWVLLPDLEKNRELLRGVIMCG